jgi:hypothetical protein
LLAEVSREGAVAEVVRDTELFDAAKKGARSFGLLPRGTLLRVTGEAEGPYSPIEVELESGNMEGWVLTERLNLAEQDRELEKERLAKEKQGLNAAAPAKKKGRRVPQDEALLLRRQPSFIYGLNGGGTYSFIGAIDNTSYSGLGFTLGAHFGVFLNPRLPLRAEFVYGSFSGASATNTSASFGFLEGAASLGYEFKAFEIFGRVHYAFASSVSNLPGTLNTTFTSVSDLGGFWAGAGVGYRLSQSDFASVLLRLGYSFSLSQSPFSFHTFRLSLYFDLQG